MEMGRGFRYLVLDIRAHIWMRMTLRYIGKEIPTSNTLLGIFMMAGSHCPIPKISI